MNLGLININTNKYFFKSKKLIEMDKTNFSLLQNKQLNALLYLLEQGYTINPKVLKIEEIDNLQRFKYAICISKIKTYSFYSSRNTKNFMDSLKNLSTINCINSENVFEEFEIVDIGNIGQFLLFSLASYFDKDPIGCYLPLLNLFDSKYSLALYENTVLDLNLSSRILKKIDFESLTNRIGGKSIGEKSKSKWKSSCFLPAIEEVFQKTGLKIHQEESNNNIFKIKIEKESA